MDGPEQGAQTVAAQDPKALKVEDGGMDRGKFMRRKRMTGGGGGVSAGSLESPNAGYKSLLG